MTSKFGEMVGTQNCVKAYLEWMKGRETYLEVGSYHGVMIATLAEAFPGKKFYAVDSYDGIVRDKTCTSGETEYHVFKANTSHLGNVILYRVASEFILPQLFRMGCMFDAIFIDGDHREEGALGDLRGAWEILSSSGILGLHDVLSPGVAAAIVQFEDEQGLDGMLDSGYDVGYFIKGGR